MKKLIFPFLIVAVFAVTISAQNGFSIDEKTFEAVYDNDRLRVSFKTAATNAHVKFELIDTKDVVYSSATTKLTASPVVFLPLKGRNDVEELIWDRLRYSVTANGQTASGIVSLSRIMPDLFELRAIAVENIYAGQTFAVRVRATRYSDGKPLAGVDVAGELSIEQENDEKDDIVFKANAKTDGDGNATLVINLPADLKFPDDDGGDLELIGRRNGLMTNTFEDFDTDESRVSIYYTLDKPLYQPGQKVQFRGLAMRSSPDGSGYTIAPDKELEFTIKDEEGITLYRTKTKTSRFGIASGEWAIPANAKLGTYKIVADSEDEINREQQTFKVSRYELPNFVVQTKSDKPFYLPDQKTADVTVDAMYLFGKPVAAGKVRVVRETNREWNFKEQKWDIKEGAAYEGDADQDGKYIAKIDLTDDLKELVEDGKTFEDLNFTAYFTDASTNRTVQRRFDLRISKEPIHVYFEGGDRENYNPKLPVTAFVQAMTADGEPCVCDIAISGRFLDEDKSAPLRPVAKGKTDKNGLAKIVFRVPKRIVDSNSDFGVFLTATAPYGRRGTSEKTLSIENDERQIIVETDKAIYKPGEPIVATIQSTEKNARVSLEVLKSGSSLHRQKIMLAGGRGTATIPYAKGFERALTVAAFLGKDSDDAVYGLRRVHYPKPSALNVSAKPLKTVYRPGDEAALAFGVKGAERRTQESALGVVILDRAVEERAATDSNGGARPVLDSVAWLAFEGWDGINLSKLTPEIQRSAESAFQRGDLDIEEFDTPLYRKLDSVFSEKLKAQFESAGKVLREVYLETLVYPKDDASLTAILAEKGVDFTKFTDPWGRKYRVTTNFSGDKQFINVVSDGADKTPDADSPPDKKDDFTAFTAGFEYFRETGLKIDAAVKKYVETTGKFVRDIETLRSVARAEGIETDALRDPWGTPYRFDFDTFGRNLTITAISAGEDRVFVKENYWQDVRLWATDSDYFAKDEVRIDAALQKSITESGTFPQSEAEFRQVLKTGGVDFDALRDGWNRSFYITYESIYRFADKITIETAADQNGNSREVYNITPVTQKLGIFRIRGTAKDGEKSPESWSNPYIANFAGVISEKAKDDAKPKLVIPKTALTNGKSAVYGVVADANGAVVWNADVLLTNVETKGEAKTKTGADGSFVVTGIAAGKYSVRASAAGFKVSVIRQLEVRAEQLVEVKIRLEVGAVSEVVTVTSDASVTIDSSDTKIDTTITRSVTTLPINGRSSSGLFLLISGRRNVPKTISGGVLNVDRSDGRETFTENFWRRREPKEETLPEIPQSATPRLRQYFPETLLWIPELVTDKTGKTSIKFRLGDNITTWNVYAVASDENGRVGVAQTEIKAFQPFFVDLDPPKFLTIGDEIYLPSQVRNYTETAKKVDVSMAAADWFEILGAGKQTLDVASNASANAVFGFRAARSVTDGPQRVTALAGKDSDAVEKPVTVRPDGEEVFKTETKIFDQRAAFDVDFPANALAGTPKAELKIYPNLLSHVAESVEGLLQRPYGCGEQTISSTYPNLMLLKFGKSNRLPAALETKAKRYLNKGFDRLAGYQAVSGGFTYWGGNDDANIALTAYALRFLTDAKDFVETDPETIEKARDFLVRQQSPDGGFTQKYRWETVLDIKQTWLLTTYVARTLAKLKAANASTKETDAVLDKALAFLKTKNEMILEPYTLALYGLAAFDAGKINEANAVAEKLRASAIAEGTGVYWNLETNTPFFGWGTAGRIETTALVLQLLIKTNNEQRTTNNDLISEGTNNEQLIMNNGLISKATAFLLRNKDRFGVWYSTQTTVNVLDALLASLKQTGAQTVEISVNGEKLAPVSVAADQIEPVTIDLTGKLTARNRVEISGSSQMMAQIVGSHYVSWTDSAAVSSPVRLDYSCDKTTAKIMETVVCKVEAERVGFKGYGMLLAEIGTPPGAEVSRESLDKVVADNKGVSRYEVLPDRIVFYLWATPGGAKFSFTFKPRYAIKAKTPASILYDYYNEEAKTTVVPMKFEVN